MLRTLGLASLLVAGCTFVQSYPAPPGAEEPAAEASAPDLEGKLPAPPCGSASDADNCGVCGHSCLGGACAGGQCQPVVLASGQGDTSDHFYDDGPVDVAADDAYAYWLKGGGALMRVAASGGTPERLAKVGSGSTRLVLSGEHLYFTGDRNTRVFRVPVAGGTPEPLASVPEGYVLDVTIAWDRLYFTEQARDGEYNRVLACPAAGCTGEPKVIWSHGRPTRLAANATKLFMSGFTSTPKEGNNLAMEGWVIGVNPEGHGNGMLAADRPQFLGVVADERELFIAAPHEILRRPVSGGTPPTVIASGERVSMFVQGLTLDADHVYWANYQHGNVVRCARTGCVDPEEITADHRAKGMAMSGGALFFITTDGRVMKLAKPAALRPAEQR
jgi:hypothetical protein